jgi:hypothetical protein
VRNASAHNLTRGIGAVEAESMSNWNNAADGIVSTGVAPPNEITVLFNDSTVTFRMPAEATLADLVGRLTEEGVPQRRQMLSVTIKLGGAKHFRKLLSVREPTSTSTPASLRSDRATELAAPKYVDARMRRSRRKEAIRTAKALEEQTAMPWLPSLS